MHSEPVVTYDRGITHNVFRIGSRAILVTQAVERNQMSYSQPTIRFCCRRKIRQKKVEFSEL